MKNAKSVYPPRPFVVLAILYLAGLIQFALGRLLLLVAQSDQISHIPVGELLRTFVVGVRFDQIIVLYILLLPLLVLPWLDLRKRPLRNAAVTYLAVLYTTTGLLLVVDVRFFKYFGTHLNYLALEYFDHPEVVWHLVGSDAWLLPAVIGTILIGVFWFLLIRAIIVRWSWPAAAGRRLRTAGWSLILIALAVIGIRGGVGLAPIDWGAAGFSQNPMLNQAALNGLYTLARNMSEQDGDIRISNLDESERFPLAPHDTALASVREMLSTPGADFVDDTSLVRTARATGDSRGYRPNVIVVVMESWSAVTTGVLGSQHDLTPCFDSASQHGYLFTKFYATGTRTNFGLPAILCSFPALPGRSIMKRYDDRHPFTSLPELLKERGYYNIFAYGGDLDFDNMRGFFRPKGYDRMVGEGELGGDKAFSKWGLPDHVMFDQAFALTDSLPRPFQMTLLTLSNHEPWDLPDSSVRLFFDDADSSRIFNSQRYADYALGRFLDSLSALYLDDSTWLVLTADHARLRSGRTLLDPETMRVPLLIVPPGGLDEGRRVSVVGSQVDILPTLLGLMGDGITYHGWGRDLLDMPSNDSGWAILNNHDLAAYYNGARLYIEWLGRPPRMYHGSDLSRDVAEDEGTQADWIEIQRRLRRYLQLAEFARLASPLNIK